MNRYVAYIEPTNALAWILGFVCADFCHYWFHRSAHRNNFMWGIHQGHHSSEDFNLSIAVRKGIFQQWVDWPFFLPMALLGFPFFTMYLPLKAAQFAYQFWVHNQFIGKLGWIEKIMVTPSLHRVHHGQNKPYIDKNYAGVFILWDRMFGSHAEEREAVIYGIGTPVRTFNPIRMQFTYWINLWRDACASERTWDRWRIWFMPTGWRPASRRNAPWPNYIEDCHRFDKYDRVVDARTKAYVLLQLAVIALLTARGAPVNGEFIILVANTIALALVLWTAWAVGLVLDQRLRSQRFEVLRLLLLAMSATTAPAVQPNAPRGTAVLLVLASLASLACLRFMRIQPRQLDTGTLESSQIVTGR